MEKGGHRRVPTLPACWLRFEGVYSVARVAEQDAVGDQQDEGTADRGGPGGAVVEILGDRVVQPAGGYPTADESTRDADERRADEAARVTARQQELGDGAGQQPQNDPADDPHTVNLPLRAVPVL